jgi:hypothetical protein
MRNLTSEEIHHLRELTRKSFATRDGLTADEMRECRRLLKANENEYVRIGEEVREQERNVIRGVS